MKKVLGLLTAAALIVVIGYSASQAADKTIAVVNGEPIFASDFLITQAVKQYQELAPQADQTPTKLAEFRETILNQRIDQILILQQAKRDKVTPTRKEVSDRVAQIKTTNFPSEAAFREYLRGLGLSNSEFEKNITDQLTIEAFTRRFAESKITPPTEQQVRQFYDQIQAKAAGKKLNVSTQDDLFITNVTDQLKRLAGPKVRWKLVFVALPPNATPDQQREANARIKDIKDALRKGTAFAQVAAQYSQEDASRQRGGDMGVVLKGDLAQSYPAVDKALFSLGVGKYTTEPIKTDAGYFFVKVEEKEPARDVKDIRFDEIGNQLANILYNNQANQALAAWLADVKAKSTIKINN
ncbi:MAG: SurA N-terminal domain-containing protein [Elusimicrobiota bacterium]|jgi:parvulin-like peptidyl-prolyl isomerase|nr:SurA N-terminal domain-containing protein [Elusimicrobiota bacterium]